MTSKKRKAFLDGVDDDDDDNFDEEDSGSDFDDDEDPDLIEVPGGGRDLNTAVTYAQNIRSGVGVTKGPAGSNSNSNSDTKTITISNHNNNNKPTSLLRTNNNNITTSSSYNIKIGVPGTAAAGLKGLPIVKAVGTGAGAAAGAGTVGLELTSKGSVPIIARKVGLENSLNNMPKKLTAMGPKLPPAARTSSSVPGTITATATATATPHFNAGAGGGGGGGSASSYLSSGAGSYLNSLSTNELMNLAAYVASKGGSASPSHSHSSTSTSTSTSSGGASNFYASAMGGGGVGGGGSGSAGGASAANFNMAASLLAQMSYAGGAAGPGAGGVALPVVRPFKGAVSKVAMPPASATAAAAAGGGAGGGAPTGGGGTKGSTSMMEAVQKLIAMNPEYLTSGIPNNVFQMFMQSMKRTPSPGTSLMSGTSPGPMSMSMSMSMQQSMQQAQANAAAASAAAAAAYVQQEEDEVDYEEMGVAETYADYWPAKLKLGKKHPDAVVETASLSSVEPCDVYYKMSIPNDTISSGQLSALQLESITYASQAHDHLLPDGSRAGFLIGDGAGVGKGRTIAGIIYENFLKGRKKALWISVSNDLKYDAQRDLIDIGASRIGVHPLNKFKYAKISSDVNNNVKRGVIFSTYSALIGESNNKTGKYRSRFRQLLQWCGEDFEGLIIFDECHKAKNLCPVGSGKPTKTGQTVLELQQKLPKARVVYASATGASEPKNMAYMVRLGLWGQGTAFSNFNDFITAVERRGVGAMEIVAMDMKLRGMYIARQLSFKGVSFKIEEVPLTKEFRKIYDQSVELWVEAMQKFTEAAELIDAESRMKKTMWGQFWSSHQRFFKYLCIAAKVNHAVLVARESIKYGKCVVIGLQSTGEARTLDQLERDDGELTDFVSTAKGVFQSFVERHFPAPDRNRINRILGLYDDTPTPLSAGTETAASNNNNNNNNNGKNGGRGKRKGDGVQTKSSQKKKKMSAGAAWQMSDSDEEAARTPSRDFGANSNSDSEGADSETFAEDDDEEDEDEDEEDADEELDRDSDRRSVASDASSDFNPFFSGSDSDIDPWVNARSKKPTKKVQKKVKKKVKKEKKESQPASASTPALAATTGEASASSSSVMSPAVVAALTAAKTRKSQQSTQDKIQDLLQKKQELKGTVTPVGVNGVKLNYGPPPKDAIERACTMKEELLRKIERLGSRLPPNTLDQLIDELGGPDNVAEMTGRRGRVVQNEDGSIQYESRTESDVPLETLNITEKQRFMDGQKDVAIISEAASSGISLQSDRRVFNQRRRVHITLELPWSADRAIQQFGRTHRSNQVNAPEYIFLISDLAGERRFASTVAKRLESLGALTHGDRRATETRDLSQFNIDNKYGRQALETVMRTIMGYEAPLVPPPTDYNGEFFKDIAGALVGVGIIVNSESNPGVLSLDKDYNNISKFLNRILGCPVDLQNRLFKYFTDTMTAIINQAKRGGRFDLGIVDLGAAGENVIRVRLIRFVRKHATGVAPTELHTVRVERGMIWQEAIDKYADLFNDNEGFYLSHQLRNQKRTAILVVVLEHQPPRNSSSSSTSTTDADGGSSGSNSKKKKSRSKREIMCQIYRPNTGLQVRHESLFELEKKYRKVASDDAEPHWTEQYDASVNTCSHAYWNGNCRNVSLGNDCEVGLRQRLYHVLAGSVLSVWGRVEHILNTRSNSKMQVIRMKTTEGEKIVGTMIPKSCFDLLMNDLSSDSEKKEEFNH
ncbi:protein strawberry notch isoform X1 [Drosophila pseudoobscura]|uniref:Protein strawberry notch isoform X1 n=1 Tax=Drosophila pseudoobscura pseudoobscura TaxID=46245 RepID=A0A6I8WBM6_DROPS|nr:protein strawberry notch isoform X1 [Drosophila pseudoobscura]